jgi:tetratricopeptide (TPR) repeat protein
MSARSRSITAWQLRAATGLVAAALCFGQEDLQEKSQRARGAMTAGRYNDAIRLYSELVQAAPQNPGLLLNLGIAFHSAGRYREAITEFDCALKLQPDMMQAKFLTGLAYQKLGEPARAIGPLGNAVHADPSNQIARLELADALLATGRFRESAMHFQKLTELDPAEPKSWQGLGFSYLSLARRCFESLEKTAPDSAYFYALLANSRDQQQQDRGAFALYRKALERDPNLRGVNAALAGIYQRTGHPDWAAIMEQREQALPPIDCAASPSGCAYLEGRYEQVIASSDSPENLYWKNRSYSELARSSLGRLAALPPSPQAHELMAAAYRAQGQHSEAARELRDGLKLDPASSRLRALLATELWLARDFDAARPALEELLAKDPNDFELSYELGDLLLQQQEPAKALPPLERAVSLKPDLFAAQASLGRALVESGRPGEAIPHFQAALPVDNDGSLYFQLSRAAEHAGKPALAKEALRQFQATSKASAARKKLEQEQEITAPGQR